MDKSISIEVVFRSVKNQLPWSGRILKQVVQGELFEFGLVITNSDKNPVKNFNIKDIVITSAKRDSMAHSFKKEYNIDLLNPGDKKTIWVSSFGTDLYGLTMIELKILPESAVDKIISHQINRFNSEEEKSFENRWVDFFYVKSSHEDTQESTNTNLLVLTIVMALIAFLPVAWDVKQYYAEKNIIQACIDNAASVVLNKMTGSEQSCVEYLKSKE